jgi:hypothetical protein
MRKLKTFAMLIVLCIGLATVAIAENNTTENNTTTATSTSAAIPVVTQTVQATQSTQTTVQPAQTAEAKEKKFRIGPTVRIRPLNDVIKKDQDGLVEIYFDNPSINSVSLTVDAHISVPSGIHVYGQGFGAAAAAGMVYGTFEVPPGGVRTINIVIKAEKTGDFDAQFTGTYYPDDNKDAYQPISLTHPFKVLEASADPMSEGTAVGTKTGEADTKTAKSPGVSFFGALLIVSILAYTIRRR